MHPSHIQTYSWVPLVYDLKRLLFVEKFPFNSGFSSPQFSACMEAAVKSQHIQAEFDGSVSRNISFARFCDCN